MCDAKYRFDKGLAQHMIKTHNTDGTHPCHNCDRKFFDDSTLHLHISTNCGRFGRENKCAICKEVFDSRIGILSHIYDMHKEVRVFKCSLCEHLSINKKDLRSHVFNYHENTNICKFCGKQYKKASSMKKHIAYEHEKKKKTRLQCPECGLTFRYLQIHIKNAHGEKNHVCSECGEQFHTELKLETHIAKVHDRSRLFECHICKSGFTSKHNLAVHISWIHEKIAGIVITIVKILDLTW